VNHSTGQTATYFFNSLLGLRVELWDHHNEHIRWVIAATSSIVIGNAAYDVAVSIHPQERVLLR
jgi:hypothetical protein